MAITKAQALTFFKDYLDNEKEGYEFWAQCFDGFFEKCVFFGFEPDDLISPTTGMLCYGVYRYPISQDYVVTDLNLDQLDLTDPKYVDFKENFDQLGL